MTSHFNHIFALVSFDQTKNAYRCVCVCTCMCAYTCVLWLSSEASAIFIIYGILYVCASCEASAIYIFHIQLHVAYLFALMFCSLLHMSFICHSILLSQLLTGWCCTQQRVSRGLGPLCQLVASSLTPAPSETSYSPNVSPFNKCLHLLAPMYTSVIISVERLIIPDL